jgi:SNF2 family DNA or RNA helicase
MKTHEKAHKYQIEALEFSLRKGVCYYMIDMGLGKTLITLMAKNNIKEPMLVVAPLRPLYSTWPAEIAKWFPEMRVSMLHGKDKDYNLLQPADIYLINPEGFSWLERKAETLKLPFKHIAIDEGTIWKSSSTGRFKIMRRLLAQFHHRFILSGTPNPQSLMDLWAQYYLLDGGKRLGRTIGKFRDKYFDMFLVNNQFPEYTAKPGALESIMEAVADITYRLDATDHLVLPGVVRNIIPLTLTSTLAKQYKEFEKDFIFEYGDIEVEAFNTAALSSKLRQFVQGGIYVDQGKDRTWRQLHTIRIEALKALIEETGQPILCAIQFKFELEMLKEAFGAIPYIGGGVSAKEGDRIIGQWNRGEIPLLVCHPKALSHGANLQSGGSIILWYGLTWSLEQYLQLNARLYRQGQLKTVVVHHFVMSGTIDVRVAKALIAKESVQQAVLDYMRNRSHNGTE